MAKETITALDAIGKMLTDSDGLDDGMPNTPDGDGGGYPQHDPAEVEALAKMLPKGNVVLATALLDSDRGVYAADPEALVAMVSASRGAEGRALGRYLKVASQLQPKLTAALKEYDKHRKRTARLVERAVSNATSATI